MNSQSVEAYKFMYKSVFEYLSTAYDITVHWRHIHGEGLYGVTLDQDWGSLKGKYLISDYKLLYNNL
jgi:hypothetical protein